MNIALTILSAVIVFAFLVFIAVKEFREFIQIRKESDLKK